MDTENLQLIKNFLNSLPVIKLNYININLHTSITNM